MALIDKRNYIQGDSEAIVDQDIGSFTINEESYIQLDGYFKFLFANPIIKLKSTSAVLVLNTDYTLVTDTRYTAKEAETGGTGYTVYSQIKIINATYAGVELTFSGDNMGSYTDNEAVNKIAGIATQTVSASGTITLGPTNHLIEFDASAAYISPDIPDGDFIGQEIKFYTTGTYSATTGLVDIGGTGFYVNRVYQTSNTGICRATWTGTEWRVENQVTADYVSGNYRVEQRSSGFMEIEGEVLNQTSTASGQVNFALPVDFADDSYRSYGTCQDGFSTVEPMAAFPAGKTASNSAFFTNIISTTIDICTFTNRGFYA